MNRGRVARKTGGTRLLWDENLSALVPQALRVLRHRASWVGAAQDGAPPRGATDEEVVAYAKHTNQVIVTQNHDMMLLCEEQGQRFVWLVPRGRQLSREEQVMIVLEQIFRWEEILATGSCVRAPRTKCGAIDPAEAARLAFQRMRRLDQRRRARRRARSKEGQDLGL
jgi:predicted nuclease of predicted toxin-antitoxin system